MTKRIAVGAFTQETNTFSPIPTGMEQFEQGYLHRGEDVLTAFEGTRLEVAGFLSVLGNSEYEPVPLMAAFAPAAGPMRADTFEAFILEFEERLAEAGPIDGVLLALHGALVAEGAPDADGAVLERLRKVAPEDIPIGVSLDLHGHITPLMLQPNTFLIGYRNYPHTDIFETGVRVAELMVDTLKGRKKPVMALTKRPLLTSAAFTTTLTDPLRKVAQAARAEETGDVLHVSIFPVQPWLDVPDLGFAVLTCADGDSASAERAANNVADTAWSLREEFRTDLATLEEAIATGLSSPGLTVVSDAGDAPAGGAAADSAAVLQALTNQLDKLPSDRLIYLTLCDPAAAEQAHKAGIGARARFALGHQFSTGTPVEIEATVQNLSNGTYTMTASGATGMEVQMGKSAVLAIGPVRVLVRSYPSIEWDIEMYRSQGLSPEDAALVFVKSPAHFRASFGPIADRIIVADTPGATRADVGNLPFRHVTRPLYPLDN